MADTKYKPNPNAPNINATKAITGAAWSEYRECFGSQLDSLVARHVVATYRKASQRARVRTVYLPILPYVCDTAAGAMDLPFRLTGPHEAADLLKRWRPTLARAWKARYAAGSCYLHVARRKGKLGLDLLWGDSLAITPDPEAPNEWEHIVSVEIPTAASGKLVYRRQPDGTYTSEQITEAGASYPLATHPILPVIPLYRSDPDTLQPPPDRTLLDLQITSGLQLSDIEFRRVYRTNQMWRRSEMSEENKAKGGSDIEASPDAVLELGANDQVGLLESSLRPADDLAYIEGFLKMAAKTLRLPPELFLSGGRSETGAARAWDFRPLLEIQETDRCAANEWLAQFIEQIRPILAVEGILRPGDELTAKCVPPKLPLPGDLLQYALGVEKLMQLGLTSPVREVATREGTGYSEAEKIVKANIKQNKLAQPGGGNG